LLIPVKNTQISALHRFFTSSLHYFFFSSLLLLIPIFTGLFTCLSMATFLFDEIIFGPVWSRRLGESLGINLLPLNRKTCNYSCLYCECGLTPESDSTAGFPKRTLVIEKLRRKLAELKVQGAYLNSITFAGNGEPTLHPDFPLIMDDVVALRNDLFPDVRIAVLSNATLAGQVPVFNTLLKADLNILKLDSGIEETILRINCPRGAFSLPGLVETLARFKGKLIIQTLFFRGYYEGNRIDNTTEYELSAWLKLIGELRPESVMIYSIARDTAIAGLERITPEELLGIATRVEKLGIEIQVTP
jgi:wyosine [tRNA(Phe)-imidazoG37] synthetase (radical SAM superfamily)